MRDFIAGFILGVLSFVVRFLNFIVFVSFAWLPLFHAIYDWVSKRDESFKFYLQRNFSMWVDVLMSMD